MSRLVTAFIRHGAYHQPERTPSAHLLYPLTADGEGQAAGAVREIAEWATAEGLRVDPVLDCSTLQRAFGTAEILAKGLTQHGSETFRTDSFDALCERCVGAGANLTVEEIEEILEGDPRFESPPSNWKSSSTYRLPFPGAESLMEAGERMAHHMRERMAELRQSTSRDTLKIFVAHGAAMRHAAHLLGVLERDEIRRLSMYHCTPVYIEATESGPWRHVGGQWKVRAKEQATTLQRYD